MRLIKQVDIGVEAHVALVEVINKNESHQMVVTNLHAPCAHNNIKLNFFTKIRESINDLRAGNDLDIVILGDFNTVMSSSERINTNYSNAERRVSKHILKIFEDLFLTDCWGKGSRAMTWKHGDKMSKIDRVWLSDGLQQGKMIVFTDWTYTESDHAAVIVEINDREFINAERITRIDTRFMSNVLLKHRFLCELKQKLEQMSDTNMNPHQKLEYLKVMIRSIALEIASEEKKKADHEQKRLKQEIDFWQSAFENSKSSEFSLLAISSLNDLTAERDDFLDKRGEYLSNRSRSQWYQEGERSTKYFLNLQRSKMKATEMRELIVDGKEINDPREINKVVESFYKKLYEKGDSKIYNRSKIDDFAKLQRMIC